MTVKIGTEICHEIVGVSSRKNIGKRPLRILKKICRRSNIYNWFVFICTSINEAAINPEYEYRIEWMDGNEKWTGKDMDLCCCGLI
jgi:hypothetical protein